MWQQILKSRWLPWSLLLVAVLFWLRSGSSLNWERVARQNAEAALDVSRSISTRHGEVYARIIAQKDVALAGALREAADKRDVRPVVQVGLTVESDGVDTTAVHHRGAGVGATVGNANAVVADTLVLQGPPVSGSVAVQVAPMSQGHRFTWDARLKPSPVSLSAALGCGDKGPELLVRGPSWASVQIDPGQVDPTICNPPKHHTPLVVKGAAVVGAVVIVGKVVKLVTSIID